MKNKTNKNGGDKMIKTENIKPKTRKVFGKVYEGETSDTHHADIVPGKYIRIHGIYRNHVNGPQHYNRVFKIGDKAEYDSYNFNYVGTIVAIGAKTVTIEDHGDRKRLDLYTFAWRNWNFDLEKIRKNNYETSMVI
jgi:hypothetical protein